MAFFSGISIILLFTLLSTMIWLQIPILRLSIMDLSMIYLMPTLVSTFTILVALLTIIWEDSKYPLMSRIFHLVPFFLFSLGSFLFLISGAIEGLLLKNTPLSESGVWDRGFNVLKNTTLALGFTFVLILLALLADVRALSLFVIGGVVTWIFVPLMLLWEEFSQKTNNL